MLSFQFLFSSSSQYFSYSGFYSVFVPANRKYYDMCMWLITKPSSILHALTVHVAREAVSTSTHIVLLLTGLLCASRVASMISLKPRLLTTRANYNKHISSQFHLFILKLRSWNMQLKITQQYLSMLYSLLSSTVQTFQLETNVLITGVCQSLVIWHVSELNHWQCQ